MITMLETVGQYSSGTTYNLASTVEVDYVNRGYARWATSAEALDVAGTPDQGLLGEMTQAGGPNALQLAIETALTRVGDIVVNGITVGRGGGGLSLIHI